MPTVTLKFTFTGDNESVYNEEVDYDLTLDPAGSADSFIEEKCKELSEESEYEDEDGETICEDFEGEYEVVGYSDFEEDFDSTDFSDLADAVEFAEFLEHASNPGAVEIYCKEHGVEYARGADDAFMGVFDDATDFARRTAEETMEIPANLANYIDYEALGSDLMSDYTSLDDGRRLYVFSSF